MRTVEEHLALALDGLTLGGIEQVPLAAALDRVLATPVVSGLDLPPWDNAAMDGYALRAESVAAGEVRAVLVDIPAGDGRRLTLPPDGVARIMTGAPMPHGADAVVQVEWTDGGADAVRFDAVPHSGANVRLCGEDVRAGTIVLKAGQRLTPASIGLAAAVGAETLPVRTRPRVAVLSTGAELVPAGRALRHGQIHDSNGPQLSALVTEAGGEVVHRALVPDDPASLLAEITACAADADLVLTTAGVSAGAHDVVKAVLRTLGVQFHAVAMRPGKPQGVGDVLGSRVLSLPGNPVSAHISFEVFVRPAIRTMLGALPVVPAPVRARLTAPAVSAQGRREYARALRGSDGSTTTVTPVGGAGSHLLASLAAADALIVIPEETTALRRGDEVDVVPLGERR